jgi:alpha-L-rhamnosidase
MPYVTAAGKPHRPLVFRREVEVGRNMKEARLYITARGVYEAAISGRKVGDHILAPGRTSYGHRLVYQTFDVSEHLVVGSNTIEVNVAEGWHCGKLGWHGGRRNIYGDSIGLIAMLALRDGSGEVRILGTDESWKLAYGPVVSSELYDGEMCDLNAQLSEKSTWDEVKCQRITDNIVAPDGPPLRKHRNLCGRRS